MAISPGTELLLAALVVAFVGAVLGSVGFAATFGRRQVRRITALTEALADASDPASIVETDGLQDPKLRVAFGRLAARVSEAWTLATVDPLTGVLNRQALIGRIEAELDRASRYGRPLSIWTISSGSTTPMAIRPATRSCATSRRRSRPTFGRSTSSAATAARSSCWSCPRPTRMPPRRWPRSSAGWWPAGRSGSRTATS